MIIIYFRSWRKVNLSWKYSIPWWTAAWMGCKMYQYVDKYCSNTIVLKAQMLCLFNSVFSTWVILPWMGNNRLWGYWELIKFQGKRDWCNLSPVWGERIDELKMQGLEGGKHCSYCIVHFILENDMLLKTRFRSSTDKYSMANSRLLGTFLSQTPLLF